MRDAPKGDDSSGEFNVADAEEIKKFLLGVGITKESADKYENLLVESISQNKTEEVVKATLTNAKNELTSKSNATKPTPDISKVNATDSSSSEEITLEGIQELKKFMLEADMSKETVEFWERIWIYSINPNKTDEGLLALLGWNDSEEKKDETAKPISLSVDEENKIPQKV